VGIRTPQCGTQCRCVIHTPRYTSLQLLNIAALEDGISVV